MQEETKDETTEPTKQIATKIQRITSAQFGAMIQQWHRQYGKDETVLKLAMSIIGGGLVIMNRKYFWRLEPYLVNLPKTAKAIKEAIGFPSRQKIQSLSAQLTQALIKLNPTVELQDGSQIPMLGYLATINARPVVSIFTGDNIKGRPRHDSPRHRDDPSPARNSDDSQNGASREVQDRN